MARIPPFEDVILREVCDVLGDTDSGLTGREIGELLSQCSIDDPNPTETKRHRLFGALERQQRRDGCGNNIIDFVLVAMNPVRYLRDRELFEDRRLELNQVLAFSGLSLGEDGQIKKVAASRTISEAQERASRLQRELTNRKVHLDVLRYCRAELLQDNYFHAVFEATKSVAEKIRDKSGLRWDGSRLVDEAFGFADRGYPVLAFNSLQTETEKSEHRGLMNLLKGLFGTFRNTTAHAPKIKWVIEAQDALDMLTLTSLLHRRLDTCVLTKPGSGWNGSG